MAENNIPAPAHWIDHFVIGTNDLNAWVDWAENTIGVNRRRFGGLTTKARQVNRVGTGCYRRGHHQCRNFRCV